MGQEPLLEFEKKSLQKQKNLERWREEQNQGFRELEEVTKMNQASEAATEMNQSIKQVREVVSDMPVQGADEKESKWKKRQEDTLKEQVKSYNQRRQSGAEVSSVDLLDEKLLTPSYVLEHFAEIKYSLDNYKFYNSNDTEQGNKIYEQEKKIYELRKEAFETSLQALGYCYITKKDGSVKLSSIDKKNSQNALIINREKREELKVETERYREAKADSVYEHYYGIEQEKALEQKKAFMEKEDFDVELLSENMTGYAPLEELRKVRELLNNEAYQEQYEENMELIRQLYNDYFHLSEVISRYKVDEAAVKASLEDAVPEEKKFLERKQKDIAMKKKLLQKRASILETGLEHLLKGEAYTEEESLVLREYGQIQGAQEATLRPVEEKASFYARNWNTKNEILNLEMENAGLKDKRKLEGVSGNRFMMLIKEGEDEHNQAVIRALKLLLEKGNDEAVKSREMGQLLKPLLQPILAKIRDYDVDALCKCNEKELEERAEELQELWMIGMQVEDLGKTIDPEDPDGRSIKEIVCGDQKEYNYKYQMISEYALRYRCHAMMKAYKLGCINESFFTSEELESQFKHQENPVVEREMLLHFLENRMKSNSVQHEKNCKLYEELEARKVVLPVLEKVKAFDTSEFYDSPDEVLLKYNQKLQELYVSMEQVKDLEKRYSIGEDLYHGDKDLWILKRDIIKFYAVKARILTLQQAHEQGVLSKDHFTRKEMEEIRKMNDLGENATVNAEHMQTYIQKIKSEIQGEDKRIYFDYFQAVDYQLSKESKAEEWKPVKRHQNFMDEKRQIIEEARAAEKKEKEENKLSQNDLCIWYGDKLQKELDELKKDITAKQQENPEDKELDKLQTKAQDIEKKLDYINILLGCDGAGKHYRMADHICTDQWESGENLNRMVDFLQTVPPYCDIPEEEYFTMFKQIYAGYREKDRATPEQIEKYREENIEGFLKFKKYMMEHTKRLKKIFPGRNLSIEYIREHFAELKMEISGMQAYTEFALKLNEIFDLTKPEDQELQQDLELLMTLTTRVPAIISYIDYSRKNYEEIWENDEKVWKKAATVREKFSKWKDERPQEEQLEEQQLTEEFRKLAKDAAVIFREGKEKQGDEQKTFYDDFITRARKLQKYVDENSGIRDIRHRPMGTYITPLELRMQQIRGWNHFVQKKRVLLENRLQMEERLQNDDKEMEGIPESIRNCAKILTNMLQTIGQSDLVLALQTADGWIQDLIRYLEEQPFYYKEEDVFQASVMTVMSLFGYVESSLRVAAETFGNAQMGSSYGHLKQQMDVLLEQARLLAPFKERIPVYAQKVRNQQLAADQQGNSHPLRMLDIVNGAQASEVFKVEEEVHKDIKMAAAELLPILEDPELEEKLKGFFDEFETGNVDAIMRLRDAMKFMQADGRISGEYKDEMQDMMRTHPDAWRDLQIYLLSEKKENWLHFADAMKKYM